MAALPPALLRAVLAFLAAPSGHRAWQRIQHARAVAAQLHALAQVSRAWYAAAHAVHTALVLGTLRVATGRQANSRSQLLELRRRATLRGAACLRELALERPPTEPLTEDAWRSILAHAPLLATLDLSRVPRPAVVGFGKPAIEAATALCPRLRALQLPWIAIAGDMVEDSRATAELLDTVVSGLAQWALQGGLRRLTLSMPFVRMDRHHRFAAKYLDALSECCPQLELVDGYEDMTLVTRGLMRDEQWHVEAETWQRFCASCTQLKAFSWVVAPFATSFFEIFGRVNKPQLTSLTFATPMNWDWEAYHRFLPSLHQQGFGATAVGAHLALRACPALTSLDVQLYRPGELFSTDPFAAEQPVNPDHLMLNQEIFGDTFSAAIARHCTQLERFTIWRVAETASDLEVTINSFTDASLRALATLPRLTWMQLTSVNITGDGLFVLCTDFAHGEWPRQRDFELSVGDKGGTAHTMAFYDIVELFLTRLAMCDRELPCASQCVLLRLLNKCYDNVDRSWSRGFLARVSPLLKAAKRKHPSIRLRIMARAMDLDDGFDRLFEFNFYSVRAEISEEYEWEDENDTRIDDVFVDRGFGGRGSREDEDDLDY